MSATDIQASCWTDEYLLCHCENYRVEDETGRHLGVVERVIWSNGPLGEAEALVVLSPERQQLITIGLGHVTAIEPSRELVVVSAAGATA